MSRNDRMAQEKLDRLVDGLIEDVLSMTDEEVLAEAAEDHKDLDSAVGRVRGVITGAIAKAGKEKMQAARKAYEDAVARDARGNVFELSLAEKRALLNRIAMRDTAVEQQVTLAARKGGELTENDIDVILEALRELGVIDDEGTPK